MADRITINEVTKSSDREELMELLMERAKNNRIRKEAEEMEKACTQAIIPILQRLGVGSIDADDDQGTRKRFVMVNGGSSTIVRQELLIKGVDPDVIEACTKRSTFVTIQVREIKSGE